MKTRFRQDLFKKISTAVLLGFLGGTLMIHVSFSIEHARVDSHLVFIGENGKLTYVQYANKGETNAINIIPDFSHAGYEGGGMALPDVPTKLEIYPIGGDNRAHVQAAINQVAAMPIDSSGFRGAVFLHTGLYEINGSLIINASGVVLRGSGQGNNGTILKAMARVQHDFVIIQGAGSGLDALVEYRQNITTEYVPTGSREFEIESTANYSVEDHIVVTRTPNDLWIQELDMAQYGWTAGSYAIQHERRITAINGTKITIDIPIVDPIKKNYGGGYVCKTNITGRISHCGIESMRLDSHYTHEEDEYHGWIAILLSRTTNSWVREVTATHFGYGCVTIDSASNFNTIQDCAMLDPISITTGGRKYSFNIGDGLGNLFQRCYCRGGRHDFVTGSQVTGPNVWLDCVAENTHADIGPHHRWATGVLFDGILGGEIRVRNRRDSGTGHGWAGAQTMFWNAHAQFDVIHVDTPLGAMNWGIGCNAATREGKGYWDLWGNDVKPRSLYLQQLQDRLGQAAVANITIQEQRDGSIWNLLSAWAGEGTPSYLS